MKIVILAGGFGTRLSEYTNLIPKPMVEIGGQPILWHIMNLYASQGYDDFVIALGYKGELIKEYFLNYYALNSDFVVDLSNGGITYINELQKNWKVTLVDTGINSLTGGRVKRLEKYLSNGTFMLTYGDAVSNVNINMLLEFHRSHGKIGTVTAVHPYARFGELTINSNNKVETFKEKPQTNKGWINGGFFVFEPELLNYMDNDLTILEKDPLEKLAKEGNLYAYCHDGFWQCMDTVRDRNILEEIWASGNVLWKLKITNELPRGKQRGS
jgi:glucose-1-phosphate cytidylyltransferase